MLGSSINKQLPAPSAHHMVVQFCSQDVHPSIYFIPLLAVSLRGAEIGDPFNLYSWTMRFVEMLELFLRFDKNFFQHEEVLIVVHNIFICRGEEMWEECAW